VEKKISIPHRYGKNRYSLPLVFHSSAFPFLIGTVRTGTVPHPCGLRGRRFPFLIGTVRTALSWSRRNSKDVFPFLIGTVRTVEEVVRLLGWDESFHSS